MVNADILAMDELLCEMMAKSNWLETLRECRDFSGKTLRDCVKHLKDLAEKNQITLPTYLWRNLSSPNWWE